MLGKIFIIILTTCFLFNPACSVMISEIPVKEPDYNNVKSAGKIKVTTIEGMEHEITQFEFTDTHIKGKQLLRGINPFSKKKNKPFEIELKHINSITVDGYRGPWGKLFTKDEIEANITTNHKTEGIISEVHIPVLLVGIPMVILILQYSPPMWTELCIFGVGSAILLTANEGYKKGKRRDILTAIDNIEKKRKEEKRNRNK